MRHLLYIIFLTFIVLTSCSEGVMDDVVNVPDKQQNTNEATIDSTTNGVYLTMPEIEIEGDEDSVFTRSALAYDVGTKKLAFSWVEGDQIGVLPDQDNFSDIRFTLDSGDGNLQGKFLPPAGVEALTGNKNYIAYSPYQPQPLSYQLLTYSGQTATENAKRGLSTNDLINASEKQASAHLGAYDYLYSEATTTNVAGSINFQMKRLGAVTRLYVKCPAQEMFESIAIGCDDAVFTISAKRHLRTGDITDNVMSKSVQLQWQIGSEADKALDMTSTTSPYYKNNVGYIIAYMMLYPVDLTDKTVNLYLVSHPSGTPSTKHYWKSTSALSGANLTANKFHQWTVAGTDEVTAEVKQITSTDYFTGTGLTSGGAFGDDDWE